MLAFLCPPEHSLAERTLVLRLLGLLGLNIYCLQAQMHAPRYIKMKIGKYYDLEPSCWIYRALHTSNVNQFN